MKFLQFKVLLVVFAVFCAACVGENRIERSSGNANTNVNIPVVDPAATPPANTVMVDMVEPELDVPYVPTHEMVVDEMLKMAQVTGNDVLYDLGSGDGRIPITAAQRFGTRGVGIDLNPQRIREANANAEKAGVTDKVRFIEGDLFETDFSEATVVTLYLLPSVNLKLKPKLLEMKPGTRVVSHNYNMGDDWKPEQTRTIKTPAGSTHYVYFWRVPERSGAK